MGARPQVEQGLPVFYFITRAFMVSIILYFIKALSEAQTIS